jgi:hypothetical protein
VKYVILTYETADDFDARRDGERSEAYWRNWAVFGGALKAAGIVADMHGLQNAETASTIRLRAGRKLVSAGPFMEGPIQLGGYFIIEAKDAAEAQDWAAKSPAAVNGAVEVRPVL